MSKAMIHGSEQSSRRGLIERAINALTGKDGQSIQGQEALKGAAHHEVREPLSKSKCPVILVVADSSPASIEAARFGIGVARRAGGQLLLVHPIHLNLNPYGPVQLSRLKADLCREACAHCEPVMLRAREEGVPAICAVEEGEPTQVITRAAKRWSAEMIVMAARERGRLARCVLRGMAERVIQRSKCPVLVLHPDGNGRTYV